ncbi:MAG: ATP-binding protein [Methylococcales bacterium]|nr:ATP-binding protein [Methylococcales bacterium]
MTFWLTLSFQSLASDAQELKQWRNQITQTRVLAENHVAAAYTQAKELQKNFPANATPIDQAKILNVLARIELYAGLTDFSMDHAEQAFELAKLHDDKVGQVEADMTTALAAINQGDIDKQNRVVMHSMTIVNEIDRPDLFAEVMLRTSMMYRRMEQYEQGIEIAVQAMEIAKQNNNPFAMSYACYALAAAYDIGDRFENALSMYEQMRVHAIEAHSKMLETDAMVGIGRMTFRLGNIADGERILYEAVASYRSIDAPFYLGHVLVGITEILHQTGRTAETVPIMDEVVKLYEDGHVDIALWWALKFRGTYYQALGKTTLANKDAQHGYQLAKEIGYPYYLNQSARQMAAIMAIQGHYKEAYQLNVEANETAEKSTKEKLNTRMLELAQRYETESKQRKINELNRLNDVQEHELKQHELHHRWLGTLLASCGVIMSLSLFFMVRLRRSKEKIALLNVTLEQRVLERTEEIHRRANYLRTFIDTLPMMAWLKDTEGRFIIVNHTFSKVAGQPIEKIISNTDLDFFPKEMAEHYRAIDAEVMTTRRMKILEEQILDQDPQKVVWVETIKMPILDQENNVLGTVGIARNVDDRKAMEDAKEQALTEAMRLATMRSEFMAKMSHELRTPLNSILGYVDVLQKDSTLVDYPDQLNRLKIIEQSGEHLLELINNILDFAKIEAGKQELHLNNVSVPAFLKNLFNIIYVRINHKAIRLLCNISPSVPDIIFVDDIRLKQVLLNLLSNAVNYTKQGEISLNVREVEQGKIRFEVQDTGSGIKAERLDTIFLPFEQIVDKSLRTEGTGLGLAISRELVRLMGGEIYVTSREGEGSCFWFDLDVAVQSEAVCTANGNVAKYLAPDLQNIELPNFDVIDFDDNLTLPSIEEMRVLHRLALEGHIRGIIEYVTHLVALDSDYEPFAERLRNLALTYQSKKILELVDHYIERN